jgi:uncharacterized protein involved in exopolysaccharide biosynthesis
VVQSLVSIFVESNLGDARKDTESARKFLDKEIEGYEKKLEEAEARLKEFKMRNLATQSAEGKDYFSEMSRPPVRCWSRAASNCARRNSRVMRSSGRSWDDRPSAHPMPARSQLPASRFPRSTARIDALQRNLDAMLQRFTEKHPDVVSTRRLIKELEEKKQERSLRAARQR